MIQRNSFYKSEDILNTNDRVRMMGYFNPYEYNFESNLKDNSNTDVTLQKSNYHNRKKRISNK